MSEHKRGKGIQLRQVGKQTFRHPTIYYALLQGKQIGMYVHT